MRLKKTSIFWICLMACWWHWWNSHCVKYWNKNETKSMNNISRVLGKYERVDKKSLWHFKGLIKLMFFSWRMNTVCFQSGFLNLSWHKNEHVSIVNCKSIMRSAEDCRKFRVISNYTEYWKPHKISLEIKFVIATARNKWIDETLASDNSRLRYRSNFTS